MDISPQQIRTAEFATTRKGLDPDEVREFLERVATELERAQNQSTAMEARARAAVARLQELSEDAAAQEAAPEPASEPEPESARPSLEVQAAPDEAETISRTLLLAQRTADTTIAEAEAEAERIRSSAQADADDTLDEARETAGRLTEEARDEARRAGEKERQAIESEVNAFKARREFLVSDVDHLETFLADERSRLREAASALVELTERVAGGLGEVRRPLLSASDDDTPGSGIDAHDVVDDGDAAESTDAGTAGDGDRDDLGGDEPSSEPSELYLQTDLSDDLDR